MLRISRNISIPEDEMEYRFIRAGGAGGQHVNKASTAVHLRFDFLKSRALPDAYKQRLLATRDRRISSEGVIVIKAQRFRSQDMNREDALKRLADLIRSIGLAGKRRIPGKPSRTSRLKRLEAKKRVARTKRLRRAVRPDEE